MGFLRTSATRRGENFRNLVSDLKFSPEELGLIYSSSKHSPYLRRHRTVVINERIKIVCLLFAALLLAWVPADLILLPSELAHYLIIIRLVSSVTLLLLAFSVTPHSVTEYARSRLLVMLLVPALFYSAVQYVSYDIEVSDMGGVLVGIYDLLPFLIIAGLALFPLTMVEMLVVSAVGLMVVALGTLYAQGLPISFYLSAGWMLLLILTVGMLSAAIQLKYMSSLLHRISIDNVTGAITRQTGQEILDLHFQLSVEEERPFAIAFVDLDNFKSINDVYGHDAGDAALTGAVRELKRMLRRGDLVVRWGGEEFLLILHDSDMNGVNLVLERLQSDWLGIRPDGKPLTASVGVAERIGDDINDWMALVEIADQRMYKAKAAGRACAVISG